MSTAARSPSPCLYQVNELNDGVAVFTGLSVCLSVYSEPVNQTVGAMLIAPTR